MRSMTKSAVRVAREALAVGRRTFPVYGSRTLRQFLRTDYRGLVTLVTEWGELRKVLVLRKVPHYSTLAYAARRLLPEAEKGGSSTTLRWSSSSGPGLPA